MVSTIRLTTASDAPLWLDLVQATLGPDYPVKEIYSLDWIAEQLDPATGQETWVAESGGRFQGSISFLKPGHPNLNPVANLGRNLLRPESVSDGSAELLLRSVTELASQRKQMAIVRIPSSDNAQQILFENLGYVCVGFQPLKHMLSQRIGILFYVRGANSVLVTRNPLSESLPQVSELAIAALEKMQIPNSIVVRDGANGYPLQTDLTVHEATPDDFELWRIQAESSNPPVEISGRFNLGFGLMRTPGGPPMRALLGQHDEKMVAGLAYYFDEHDRCARIVDAFCSDDLSMGALLAHGVKVMQQLSAIYTEVDILATAPRLLKSAEQLGFVPVAYLPAFFGRNDRFCDVVKLVKLNLPYSLENGNFTAHARSTVTIIDRNFEDQKLGLAIINLLRPLSIFTGLGDGELRKIARLFVQKLYRPNDHVFAKGDSGDEAYIVLRGKISIQLEKDSPAVAQLGDGKIFGELAFLDGSPRGAFAVASQPSILLVMKRSAFGELVRREPNLGMTVMRNLAQDLALKLRGVNETLSSVKKAPAKA
ncbi:MAG TPA: cyclic nucleotide-binding domain-containing protein [Candidatus Saccharimonadales bacterium]|nr:cyclic nucleotide-binding domain-containing protein [Candidatus Saccharimonadales bacterium]